MISTPALACIIQDEPQFKVWRESYPEPQETPGSLFLKTAPVFMAVEASSEKPGTEEGNEIPKYFTVNQTGNVMISTTVKEEEKISASARELFEKTLVFFSAVTVALSKNGKTLHDYEAVEKAIGQSGVFAEVHREDRTFSHSSSTVSLDTNIITSVLGVQGGTQGAMKIAKQVVSGMGEKLRLSSEDTKSNKKVSHLLFICESLLGAAMLTVQLIGVEANTNKSVLRSNCAEVNSEKVTLTYHQVSYIFADPLLVKKYSKDFSETHPDFEILVGKLSNAINPKPKEEADKGASKNDETEEGTVKKDADKGGVKKEKKPKKETKK
jgi:hypothetical protein